MGVQVIPGPYSLSPALNFTGNRRETWLKSIGSIDDLFLILKATIETFDCQTLPTPRWWRCSNPTMTSPLWPPSGKSPPMSAHSSPYPKDSPGSYLSICLQFYKKKDGGAGSILLSQLKMHTTTIIDPTTIQTFRGPIFHFFRSISFIIRQYTNLGFDSDVGGLSSHTDTPTQAIYWRNRTVVV